MTIANSKQIFKKWLRLALGGKTELLSQISAQTQKTTKGLLCDSLGIQKAAEAMPSMNGEPLHHPVRFLIHKCLVFSKLDLSQSPGALLARALPASDSESPGAESENLFLNRARVLMTQNVWERNKEMNEMVLGVPKGPEELSAEQSMWVQGMVLEEGCGL